MSFLRGLGQSESHTGPGAMRVGVGYEEQQQQATRSGRLAMGTLACVRVMLPWRSAPARWRWRLS